MIRFIFVCMAVVAFSFVAIGAQSLLGGIDEARNDVLARNQVDNSASATVANDDGISFEEIYANAPVQTPTTAEDLNALETAAGGNEFSDDFTNTAPAALSEPTPAPVPTTETSPAE